MDWGPPPPGIRTDWNSMPAYQPPAWGAVLQGDGQPPDPKSGAYGYGTEVASHPILLSPTSPPPPDYSSASPGRSAPAPSRADCRASQEALQERLIEP